MTQRDVDQRNFLDEAIGQIDSLLSLLSSPADHQDEPTRMSKAPSNLLLGVVNVGCIIPNGI